MRADVFAPVDLPLDLQAAWRTIQHSHPTFAGPCFHPRLFQVFAGHIPDIRIAVLTHDSGAFGFLPYLQSKGERVAHPIPACDYQAIIADPAIRWDMREVLERLNLVAWDFDNLVTIASTRPPLVAARSRSPRVTLERGHAQYVEGQKQAGKSGRNLKIHRRLLIRNHGEMRFVAASEDHSSLRMLMQWKAARFMGFADWARQVMEALHARSEGDLTSVLSILSAGDSIVAAHFGLRCDGVLHYWFPGFDPAFSRYSTSRLLTEDLIAHLSSLQCQTLDLGPGGESYKDYFANANLDVLAGHYERPALATYARSAHRRLRNFIKSHPLLYRAVRPLVQTFRGTLSHLRTK